jgi:hypothetical protein
LGITCKSGVCPAECCKTMVLSLPKFFYIRDHIRRQGLKPNYPNSKIEPKVTDRSNNTIASAATFRQDAAAYLRHSSSLGRGSFGWMTTDFADDACVCSSRASREPQSSIQPDTARAVLFEQCQGSTMSAISLETKIQREFLIKYRRSSGR